MDDEIDGRNFLIFVAFIGVFALGIFIGMELGQKDKVLLHHEIEKCHEIQGRYKLFWIEVTENYVAECEGQRVNFVIE